MKERKDKYEVWADRNLKGQELEKAGNTEKAIKLYEVNVRDGFDGSHPYKRLAIIYGKAGDFDNEIRILTLALKSIRFREEYEVDRKKQKWFEERLAKRIRESGGSK